MTEIVVLGAGPAGLMAALEAARAGHRCTVVEASSRVGGMAGSFAVGGQRVDYGSHRLHPATPPSLLGPIRDLLGTDLQVRPRRGRIHLGGRWVGFPLRAADLLRVLPPRLTGAMMADSLTALAAKLGPSPDHRSASFHDQVARQLGRTVADRFYGPFATKLYGVDPRDLSGELARRRVSATSPADIAARLVRARKPGGRTFYYPRRGYGQISERLAEAAVAAGAVIELDAPALGVSLGSDRVTITAGSVSRDAAVALSTIPVTTLATITDPPPPPEVAAALARLRTRAMILVYLILDRPRYTDFDAHYIPGLDTTVARLSEPKNYRDGDDPPTTTVLCAEIACWTDDEIWEWDDTRLAELVVEDLARVGLPRARHVGAETRRLPSVYPVYDIATEAARVTVDGWNTGPRLVTLGRQGLRVIDNLHHVLDMGRAAVATIGDAGTVDEGAWRHRLNGFALHTVED